MTMHSIIHINTSQRQEFQRFLHVRLDTANHTSTVYSRHHDTPHMDTMYTHRMSCLSLGRTGRSR